MSKATITLIQYYVPEDKDDISIMNAFVISKPLADIKLSDIIESFPLEGVYHFRFKYSFKGEFVWLDLNNANCKPPQASGAIVMKATRISWGSKRTHKKSLSSDTPPKVKPAPSSLLIDDMPSDHKQTQPVINTDANFDLLFKN
jgi:hypothetical protein